MIITLRKGKWLLFVVPILLCPNAMFAQKKNVEEERMIIEIYTEADLDKIAPFYGVERYPASAKDQTKTKHSDASAKRLLSEIKTTYEEEVRKEKELEKRQIQIVDWYFSTSSEVENYSIQQNIKKPKSGNP